MGLCAPSPPWPDLNAAATMSGARLGGGRLGLQPLVCEVSPPHGAEWGCARAGVSSPWPGAPQVRDGRRHSWSSPSSPSSASMQSGGSQAGRPRRIGAALASSEGQAWGPPRRAPGGPPAYHAGKQLAVVVTGHPSGAVELEPAVFARPHAQQARVHLRRGGAQRSVPGGPREPGRR